MPTKLCVPIPEAQIRQLRIGDQVLLSGVIFTGRDAAHKYMKETFIAGPCPQSEKPLYDILKKGLAGGVIYHCGPVVKKGSVGDPPAARIRDAGLGGPALRGVAPVERYEFVAAGPTTSIREEPYQAAVIEHFGLRAVIGKGGMGARTLEACGKFGAVYLHAIGGAATLIAESVKEVVAVHKLEFGVPEAFWQIRVEDFPCVVTMDSHGASLHAKVRADSQRKLKALLAG
ncbi:MAG: FumA C-terminus/TtdB family hydratase beta subunit [Planctomycetota bacterium]